MHGIQLQEHIRTLRSSIPNLTPSNLRLDSKQLVSEFLQDALSKKMR